jgi:N-acetylglucosaminyldiphosphoundecaprenol N-acetyl-beta-D-mannosaminyltransferase
VAAQEKKETINERLNLLRVPLDIIPREELENQVSDLLYWPKNKTDSGHEEGKNLVLLSLWDLLRARRKREYRNYVLKSPMVIPISKSLVGGARFLKGKTPIRYMPFHFIVDLLSILETRECTIYLLGSTDRTLRKVESNIRQTFPGLRIVGRCDSSFRRQNEKAIVEAIRKTSPQLLLVGKGVPGGELWIARHHKNLNNGLRLWCSDIFDVFAERKTRPPEWVFNSGLESLTYGIKKPYKIFRLFLYFYYKLLLLIYKIMKKN